METNRRDLFKQALAVVASACLPSLPKTARLKSYLIEGLPPIQMGVGCAMLDNTGILRGAFDSYPGLPLPQPKVAEEVPSNTGGFGVIYCDAKGIAEADAELRILM